ncbi:MAG TPA: acyl-CoA synthetase [Stellaceae bacterium]|nr:acyl-CoA synthetase [Stellaceae bacterium]
MQAITKYEDIAAIERVPAAERLLGGNVYEAIGRIAARLPNKPAIHYLPTGAADDPGITYTYRQFFARITQTANLLHDLGVGPRDVVSLLLPILPETFFMLWGGEAAGISNPINPYLETPHILGILKEAGTKVLVGCDPSILPDIWPKVEAARRELPGLKAVIRIGGKGPAPEGVIDYEAVIDRYPADRLVAPHAVKGDDVAALFHTGGTTGVPKLAQQTHLGQMVHAWTNAAAWEAPETSVILNGLPLFHVGGALCGGLSPFCNGSTVVMLSPMGMRNPNVMRDYFRIAERFRATSLGLVPTAWAALLNVPTDGVDLSSVRYLFSGASTMPIEVARALEKKLGKKLVEGYGMTEVHGFTAMNPTGGEVRIGSVGFRTPYTELMIGKLDPDGKLVPCATDEIGMVLMRGPQVFKGYVNPSHNKGAWFGDGWFNSGDLGRLDKDGYIWLTGRAKDLIIRGGHNIDPIQIEEVLYQHPAVEGAAAVARPDRYAGELPVAYVQLRPGAKATPEELLDFARARIAERAAVPLEITIIPMLPQTNVGKVFKPQLRFDAAQHTLERELAPLAKDGVGVKAEVAAHRTHGTLATITLTLPKGGDKAAVIKRCEEMLMGFPLRYEVIIGA